MAMLAQGQGQADFPPETEEDPGGRGGRATALSLAQSKAERCDLVMRYYIQHVCRRSRVLFSLCSSWCLQWNLKWLQVFAVFFLFCNSSTPIMFCWGFQQNASSSGPPQSFSLQNDFPLTHTTPFAGCLPWVHKRKSLSLPWSGD